MAAECLDPKHPLISNAIRLDGHCSDMKAAGRRWLVAGLYVASLAAVAALSAYLSRNLTGSGPIPDRSSFARRLPGVPDGDARRFNFFYATNRAMDDLHQRLLQPDNPIGRRLYPIRSEQGATFWLLWDY